MNAFTKTLLATVVASIALAPIAASAEIRSHRIKLAMTAPQGSALYDAGLKLAELVREQSDGKMKITVFEGGKLGGDLQVIGSLQGGTIEMDLTNASFLQSLVKEMTVYDLPFLFANEEEADAVVDGPVGKKLLDLLPEHGIVGLAYMELGFRHVTNSKRPITKLEDLQGLKLRILQTPIYIDFINALGANATPLPYPEVFSALETKTVDGATNTVTLVQAQKFDEVQKYLSLTHHMYNPSLLFVSKKFWDGLNAEERQLLQEAADQVRDFERKLSREKTATALAELAKTMEINEVTPEERARMREQAKPVIDKYTAQVGASLVQEIEAEIAKSGGGS